MKPAAGLVESFVREATRADEDVATAALLAARVEYPRLDPSRYLERLETMGRVARARLEGVPASSRRAQVRAIGEYLFGALGFDGNVEHYEDPRNSFLNEVLDRRTGIPITLSVVFMEVARRAGVPVEGVNFPRHFLLRSPAAADDDEDLLIDAFGRGALLTLQDCYQLAQPRSGAEMTLEPEMFRTAGKRDILLRMLQNLKRSWVRLHAFPQARGVADLLVALDPGAGDEVRDRGLLALRTGDYTTALRDLESWLRQWSASRDKDEREQVWEQVKELRRRLALMN